MRLSISSGSSFASAWLAGRYASLARYKEFKNGSLGTLSKIARLMQRTENCRIASGPYRLPCFVALITDRDQEPQIQSEINELLSELRAEYHADFCLYGSSAAVAEWLHLNHCNVGQIEKWAIKDLGDVDLLHAGAIVDDDTDGVKEFVREWYKQRLGRSWVTDRKRPIELHPYEGLLGGAERLRSVTPVNKFYITSVGVIDTWGGIRDLRRGKISFYPLAQPMYWSRNSLFSSGSDCLALNILHWISIVALLQIVSRAVNVAAPIADPASVAAVFDILDQIETGANELRLFGFRPSDTRERLDRRFERVETLLGSCSRKQMVDENLDALLKKLYLLRAKLTK